MAAHHQDELGSGPGTHPLQQMNSSGADIAAAGSQDIATKQQVPGRHSSSRKASYEAVNLGMDRHEFSISSDLPGPAASTPAANEEKQVEEQEPGPVGPGRSSECDKRSYAGGG